MLKKIREYHSQLLSNKLFRQTMKSYFIIACMVFLAYAAVVIISVSRAGIIQMTSAGEKMLAQAEKTNDFILRNITSAANYVFENETSGITAMTKPYSPQIAINASNTISEIKSKLSAIDKVYFFNLKDDFIYTGENPVYTKDSFPDKELLDMVASSGRYDINKPHMLRYETSSGDIVSERAIISLYKYNDTSCMVVATKSSLFDGMVNADSSNKEQSMMILQNNGIVLSSTDPSLFGTNLSDDKMVNKIMKKSGYTGYINSGGRIYCYRKSDSLNSLYISSFKSSSVIVSYVWQLMIIILFALLLVFLYFISSMQISMSIFRPFRRLRSDLFRILGLTAGDLAELGTDSDLQLIADNLTDIKKKYDSMQETENLYSETKRNELVYRLLTGSCNLDENELNDYDMRLYYPYNTVVVFRLDNTKKIERSNIGLILYGISNAGIELFSNNHTFAYSTTYSDEYDVVFLLNHSQPTFIPDCLTMLQKYITKVFGVTASASYDSAKCGIDSVVELYRNAKYAMQYRIVYGRGSVIGYNTLTSEPPSSNEYPHKLEKALIRELNQKNREGAQNVINEFMEALSAMTYSSIIINASMLIMAINSVSVPGKNEEDWKNDIISESIIKAETLDDIHSIITAKCNNVFISTDTGHSADKYLMIANSIEEFINKHYSDPNLSIDVIASYVNKSANYARSIFKSNKGVSISEYITHKRFEEVCRLLRETNLTAQAISQKTGLSSGSYFYTAFKKYTGYTPEQYRKKYLKASL